MRALPYFLTVILLSVTYLVPAQEQVSIDWNDDELNWLDYDTGLKTLKDGKNVGLLILYADWCPTCKAYSRLFTQAAVVKSLQGITLIRANIDKEPLINAKYDKDGTYIPRTFAIDSLGNLVKPLHPDRPRYDYFLPVEKPDYLVNFATRLKSLINRAQ